MGEIIVMSMCQEKFLVVKGRENMSCHKLTPGLRLGHSKHGYMVRFEREVFSDVEILSPVSRLTEDSTVPRGICTFCSLGK